MSLKPHVPLILAISVFAATLVLIIRFGVPLLTGRAQQAKPSIQTPGQKAKPPALDSKTTLRLVVKSDGGVHVDGQLVPDDSLASVVQQRNPKKVLLWADYRVPYDRIKALITKLDAAGVHQILFHVDDPRSAAATPAAAGPSSPAETK